MKITRLSRGIQHLGLRKLSKKHLIKWKDLPTPLKKKLSPNNSVIPKIYGLPKIHKEGVPLRPIVCTIGSPSYNLAKELSRILSPISGQTDTYIKNSSHLHQQDQGFATR